MSRTRFLCFTILAAGLAAPVAARDRFEPAFRPVPFREASLAGVTERTAEIREGTIFVRMPFALLWEGQRYTELEVGVGWARAVPGSEIGDDSMRGLPASVPGAEAGTRSGPRFEVLAGEVQLGPSARVLVAGDPFSMTVRWWGLEVAGVAAPVSAELLIGRSGAVRFQYLQADWLRVELERGDDGPLAVRTLRIGVNQPGRLPLSLLRGGELAPGLTLKNAVAVEVVRSDDRLSLVPAGAAPDPPPTGCVPPSGDWCQIADGPNLDTNILLDSRFEETPVVWTTSAGFWHPMNGTVCPAAPVRTGMNAYVGDDVSCQHVPSIPGDELATVVGPITATTEFTFASRWWINSATTTLRIEVGRPGDVDVYSMPMQVNRDTWFNFNPISLGRFAGQMINIKFIFFSAGAPPGNLGWMVDDVFVYDVNGANLNCVRQAKYFAGNPALADCSDTVHDDWAFNESEFCLGCDYTFYALIECGTEMHLPLSDMEGAEVTITDMITGLNPVLRCVNDVFRDPVTAPTLVSRECCAAQPGLERWTGPAWSATDNNGAGSVAWGFPGCDDLIGTYDANANNQLECTELTPTCGGELALLSPGEGQGMDCSIASTAGLCGVYRIDVRSGGFVWDLFANCDGTTTPGFDLYTSCTDAWAAFNPLPEIAITDVQEIQSCPNVEVQFTLRNLGCADLTSDLTVRATSDCPVPDVQDWTVTGGIVANGTLVTTRMIAVSCAPATLTVQVDPANVVSECSESPNAAACAVIPGADQIMVSMCQCGGVPPPIASADQVCESEMTSLSCGTPMPGTYDWDFEDDGTFDATGCDVTHTYPAAGMYRARVRYTIAGGCSVSDTVDVTVDAGAAPAQGVFIVGAKTRPNGLFFLWAPLPGASSYRVARGTLRNFYDHTVDQPAGVGSCDTLGVNRFDDPDDLLPGTNYYYLVAPLGSCGSVGPYGWPHAPLPPAIPSASCP